jgi:hypothetical protein
MTLGLFAFAIAWKFIAPDAPEVVAMDWKRVLESPLSAAIRREIPATAAPVLASVNFIEGISHAVWTPGLVVLEGAFDLERLKDMATADGGTVKQYKKAELLAPAEDGGTHVGLVSSSVVLLGVEENVKAAIDRAEKLKSVGPTGYDLWIRTSGPGFQKHEFRIDMAEDVRINSKLRHTSEDAARAAVENASVFRLTGTRNGVDTSISGRFSRDEFAKQQWRSVIESLPSSTASSGKPTSHPGVIRIHGLEGGVKEIPLK